MPKKDFTTSARMTTPLANILPQAEPEPKRNTAPSEPAPAPAKQGSKYVAAVDPYDEPRNRRVQLIMRPSLYAGLKYIATRRKSSVNNLVEIILAEYIEREKQAQKGEK